MNPVITIPKTLTKRGDLVVIPREEYEEFVRWKRTVRTFKASSALKRDLARAREDYRKGKFISLDELKRKLDIAD